MRPSPPSPMFKVPGSMFKVRCSALPVRNARDETINRPQHMLNHLWCQSRIHADEKGISRDEVAVGERPDDAVLNFRIGRMPQQVPAEKVARLDTRRLQRIDQFGARERRLGSDGGHEARSE